MGATSEPPLTLIYLAFLISGAMSVAHEMNFRLDS